MSVYYNEIDPFAAAWLRELIKAGVIADGEVDERSIRDVQASDLRGFVQCHFFAGIGVWSYALRNAGWPDDRAVWTGSCPCQPFSVAGRRGGSTDDRHLWPDWFRLINECRPLSLFGEQVASPDGLNWLDLVHTDLEGAGYTVGAADLCAAGVGAPHIRQRLWFVADAEGARGRSHAGAIRDGATEGLREPQGQDKRRTVWEAGRPSRGSAVGELGDSNGERYALGARQLGDDGSAASQAAGQAIIETGVTRRGFWAYAEWIACRDGKTRPVEPGTFPLAHGVAARVGRLRGYGNSLVAPVAQVFIEAYLDTLDQ